MDWVYGLFGVFVLASVFYLVRPKNKKKLQYIFNEALLSPDEKQFKDLLNGYRQTVGLSYLRADRRAGFVAKEHCMKMAKEQRIFHNTEDGRYDGLVGGSHFAEIVNGEFHSVKTCFWGFMKSPDHFKVMNGNYNAIGLSIERDEDNEVYATVIFFRT